MAAAVPGSGGSGGPVKPSYRVTVESIGDQKVPSLYRTFVRPATSPKPLVAPATIGLLQDWSSWLAGFCSEGVIIPAIPEGQVNLSSQTRNCIMNSFLGIYNTFREARDAIDSLKNKEGKLTFESARKNFSCMRLFSFAQLSSFLAFSLTSSYSLINKFAQALGSASFPGVDTVSSISSYLFAAFGISKILTIGAEHRKIQKVKHELFETSALDRIGYCFKKAASCLRIVEPPRKLNERVSVQEQVANLKKLWEVSDQEAIAHVGGKDKLEAYFDNNITTHVEATADVLGISKTEIGKTQTEILASFRHETDPSKLNPAFSEYIHRKLGIDVEKSGLNVKQTMALVMIKAELLKSKQDRILNLVCEGTKDKVRTREMIETTLKMRSIATANLSQGEIGEAEKILMDKLQSSMNRKDWKNVAMMLYFALSVAIVIASFATPMGPSVVLTFFIISMLANTISYAVSLRDFSVAIEDEKLAPPRQRELSKSPFISGMQKFAEKRLPREEKFWLVALINVISIGLIVACCVLNPPAALLVASSAITIGLYSVTQFALQIRAMREKAAILANKIDSYINQPIARFFGSAVQVQKEQLDRFEKLKHQYEEERIVTRFSLIPLDSVALVAKQYAKTLPLTRRVQGKLKPVSDADREAFLLTQSGKQALKDALVEEARKDPKTALENYRKYKQELRTADFDKLQLAIQTA